MARPDKLNAMDATFFRELPRALDEIVTTHKAAVCVLTGSGSAFSAGGDIATFIELDDVTKTRRHLRLVYDAFHSVERAEIPVIGAVNGIAYGGGTEITLACDLAFASTAARFAFKEVTIGLMPGYGIIRGPQVIGRRWTRRLAMTGEDIDAETARRIGLVEDVHKPDQLMPSALALACQIRDNADHAVRLAKQFINRDQSAPGQAESIEATALLFTTEEHRKRAADFLDRP